MNEDYNLMKQFEENYRLFLGRYYEEKSEYVNNLFDNAPQSIQLYLGSILMYTFRNAFGFEDSNYLASRLLKDKLTGDDNKRLLLAKSALDNYLEEDDKKKEAIPFFKEKLRELKEIDNEIVRNEIYLKVINNKYLSKFNKSVGLLRSIVDRPKMLFVLFNHEIDDTYVLTDDIELKEEELKEFRNLLNKVISKIYDDLDYTAIFHSIFGGTLRYYMNNYLPSATGKILNEKAIIYQLEKDSNFERRLPWKYAHVAKRAKVILSSIMSYHFNKLKNKNLTKEQIYNHFNDINKILKHHDISIISEDYKLEDLECTKEIKNIQGLSQNNPSRFIGFAIKVYKLNKKSLSPNPNFLEEKFSFSLDFNGEGIYYVCNQETLQEVINLYSSVADKIKIPKFDKINWENIKKKIDEITSGHVIEKPNEVLIELLKDGLIEGYFYDTFSFADMINSPVSKLGAIINYYIYGKAVEFLKAKHNKNLETLFEIIKKQSAKDIISSKVLLAETYNEVFAYLDAVDPLIFKSDEEYEKALNDFYSGERLLLPKEIWGIAKKGLKRLPAGNKLWYL